jgi:Ca-activated chloride channel family protein
VGAGDAGEVSAGESVTALYEVVPVAEEPPARRAETVVILNRPEPSRAPRSGELLRLELRYQDAAGGKGRVKRWTLAAREALREPSADFRFAAGVAAFGMLLRDPPHEGGATPDLVLRLAEEGRGLDPSGQRTEFLRLVARARELWAAAARPTR